MKQNVQTEARGAQKANDCITSVQHFRWPQRLFDEFWRERELAVLFGPPGVGKSVFAVQLADTLARGRSIGTFRMPGYRRRTLYVDMVMSPAKFRLRYSYFPGPNREAKCYRFSESLCLERPPAHEAFGVWLRKKIRDGQIEVVIIDDLSALRQTDDGTAEALRIMRELKVIADRLSVSILVLTTSVPPPNRALVSEADLRRARAVCNVTDSVFALGYHPRSAGGRYLIQTRSRHAAPVWNETNAPVCSISMTDKMMLGLKFDDRFTQRMDPELLATILKIKAARDRGTKYRDIAEQMGLTVSKVSRLIKKWTPDMGSLNEAEEEQQNSSNATRLSDTFDDDDDFEEIPKDYGLDALDEPLDEPLFESNKPPQQMDVTEIPFAAALRRLTIYDLEPDIDAYGRDIYVEERSDNDHKPKISYQITRQGNLIKSTRGPSGVKITNLGKTHYISDRKFPWDHPAP